MKQYIYNVDTIKKNFLASYADTIIKENKLFLVNILTDRQILVEGSHSLLEQNSRNTFPGPTLESWFTSPIRTTRVPLFIRVKNS